MSPLRLMLKCLRRACLGVGLAVVLASSLWTGQATSSPDSRRLVLGMVSEINQSEIKEHFAEFVAHVAKRLYPEAGNSRGRVTVAPTPFGLAKLLEQRRVDFYLESVYPTYTINYVHNVGKTVLRRHKSGQAEYQSLIFAHRNGPIKRLDDLRGKTIVFEDSGSTSGYLLPKLFLQKQGFKLVEKRGYDPNGAPAVVGYVFAYAQDKLVDLVRRGEAQAGAFSDDDYAGLSDAVKAELVVLAQTERLPRHLVSVRADLDVKLANRIEEILLGMADEDAGRRILARIDRTTKFDRLPGGEAALKRRLLDTFFTPGPK
ncbi:MAG: phosphate/phosphite/phosphonate ABC transporter substrate-binding protein [Deltaproteobacteria bacterium]|nr:phosphate/phosphite/phosphonate ABC transporter substrate-binding protein [Deltaproteobacteria bacterium]